MKYKIALLLQAKKTGPVSGVSITAHFHRILSNASNKRSRITIPSPLQEYKNRLRDEYTGFGGAPNKVGKPYLAKAITQ